jgi:nucleoside-diphosphate-sugar epimerase
LLIPGSFAAAMRGCSVVFHTASPFLMDNHVSDPIVDLIQPAVQGTENVLRTACSSCDCSTVQTIVLTSSVAALLTHASEHPVTEQSWNRTATTYHMPYCLSKTLAEKAAWVIAGGQTQWKLVVLLPSLVLGPGLQYSRTSESYRLVEKLGSGVDWECWLGSPNLPCAAVDVRDVAEAHVAAAFSTSSGRYIIHGTNSTLPGLARMIAEGFLDKDDDGGGVSCYPIATRMAPIPKWLIWLVIPLLFRHVGLDRRFILENMNYQHQLDASRSIQELGIQYRPLNEALQQMYQQVIDAGRVVPKRWYHSFMSQQYR